MKRFMAILASAALFICSLSCSYRGTYDDGYEDGYSDGHYEGLCDGYEKGIERAKERIASRVEDDIWDMERDIENEHGINPWEAVEVLSNYADVPDEVTEEELHKAIWAIYSYYNKLNEVINGIEDYWID